MYSCGKFVRITAHYNLWGQTLIFEKWDFNGKNSCFYKVPNVFNVFNFSFFKNRISHLDTHAISYGVGKIHRALISF